MHGTYNDPDGDTPMALTASSGTITDDGDGVHWTWTHTGGDERARLRHGDGSDGLKDQAVFQLKINAPPVLTVPGPQTADLSRRR